MNDRDNAKSDLTRILNNTNPDNRDKSISIFLKKFLNFKDDGVAKDHGYLIIEPNDDDRGHLALKVNDDGYFTVSATTKALEIGFLKDLSGKEQPKTIVTIDKEKGLNLEGQFTTMVETLLKNELDKKDLAEVVMKKLSESNDKPLQIGRKLQLKEGIEYLNNEKKGISTTGFIGFIEDTVPADGRDHCIGYIPKDSNGAYKIRAWLTNHGRNKEHLSLESTVYFFSDGIVKPYPFLWRIWLEVLSLLNKIVAFNYPSKHRLKAKVVKSKTSFQNIKLLVENTGGKKELKLTTNSASEKSSNKDTVIYFSIERLWEGPDWIQPKKTNPDNNE